MRVHHYDIVMIVLLSITTLSYADNINTKLSVYKNQQCGCCNKWVTHLESSGFQIDTHNLNATELNALKSKHTILPEYQSCHTAVYQEKYVFEGHIPAKFISKFLLEKPEGAIGLSAPGMPVGSPGMEVDTRFSPYDVLLLKENGAHEIYVHIDNYKEQF